MQLIIQLCMSTRTVVAELKKVGAACICIDKIGTIDCSIRIYDCYIKI